MSLFDDDDDMIHIELRQPCPCGGTKGHIVTRGGQDCVYCDNCGAYQHYNASRIETGRAQRTLASRPGISVSMRQRIMARFLHACIDCGRRPPDVVLDLDHVISREQADAHGLLDELIDSEWNLAPTCQECNSGARTFNGPQVHLMYRCILMAQRTADRRP